MSLPQSRVLIVDDSRVLCLSVEGLLGSEQDIVCRSVMKAKDSMEAAIAFGPTVILQDLIMPDVEDLEMISLFKTTRELVKYRWSCFPLTMTRRLSQIPSPLVPTITL